MKKITDYRDLEQLLVNGLDSPETILFMGATTEASLLLTESASGDRFAGAFPNYSGDVNVSLTYDRDEVRVIVKACNHSYELPVNFRKPGHSLSVTDDKVRISGHDSDGAMSLAVTIRYKDAIY